MAANVSTEASNSMVITGSIVAVVGVIFLVTIDIAFVMMTSFGAAVAVLGLYLSRKEKARSENSPESPEKG